MKTRNIFAIIVAFVAILSSCQKTVVGDLEEYKVDNSFISIPKAGGGVTIHVDATVNWFIDTTGMGKWLNLSPIKGEPGITKVSFSADSTDQTRKATLFISNSSNKKVQYLYVTQQADKPKIKCSTCKEVLTGQDGKEYMVKGNVTAFLSNSTTDILSMADTTGSLYLFGVRNKKGEVKKDAVKDYGIEIGDEVTVQGERATFGTTVELKDVTVINVVKSLVQLVSDSKINVGAGADTVSVKVIRKGNNLDLSTSVQWLSILSTYTIPGSSGADTTVVNVCVAANTDVPRKGNVLMSSSKSGQTSRVSVQVSQASAK